MTIFLVERVDLSDFERHLFALDNDDRYMRFGYYVNDDSVSSYIQKIEEDHLLTGFKHHDDLIAAAHVGLYYHEDKTIAELGVSVNKEHRNQGLGTELVEKGIEWAFNNGAQELHTMCLGRNGPMKKVARKNNMLVSIDGMESFARVELCGKYQIKNN